MNLYYKYLPQLIGQTDLSHNLKVLKELGFAGVFFPYYKPACPNNGNKRQVYYPLEKANEYARQTGLKFGVYVACFQSSRLWAKENFSPPVNHTGTSYIPDGHYFPVCPNNPMGMDNFYRIVERLAKLSPCDFYLFEYLRFPFNWQKEDLDVQYHLPKFCYCPFCVTEFSSVMGEVVSYASQIMDYLAEWLDWRSNVITNLIGIAHEALAKKGRLIISVPPLALIDLPFTTGQIPSSITDMGCFLSPKLYHPSKPNNLPWIEDILDQYSLEINLNKLFPALHVRSQDEIDQCLKLGDKYKLAGALLTIIPPAMN